MRFDPDVHHRRSIRLRDYDYSTAGAYFVTICTFERECLLGDVVNGEMRLNGMGQIVQDEWLRTAEMRNNIVLDEFIVMPNHFHGIIHIRDTVGAHCMRPDHNERTDVNRAHVGAPLRRRKSGSIGSIIAGFKSAATKRINQLRDNPGTSVWQRNYYERIIRNDQELQTIQQYIVDNPATWQEDENHPTHL